MSVSAAIRKHFNRNPLPRPGVSDGPPPSQHPPLTPPPSVLSKLGWLLFFRHAARPHRPPSSDQKMLFGLSAPLPPPTHPCTLFAVHPPPSWRAVPKLQLFLSSSEEHALWLVRSVQPLEVLRVALLRLPHRHRPVRHPASDASINTQRRSAARAAQPHNTRPCSVSTRPAIGAGQLIKPHDQPTCPAVPERPSHASPRALGGALARHEPPVPQHVRPPLGPVAVTRHPRRHGAEVADPRDQLPQVVQLPLGVRLGPSLPRRLPGLGEGWLLLGVGQAAYEAEELAVAGDDLVGVVGGRGGGQRRGTRHVVWTLERSCRLITLSAGASGVWLCVWLVGQDCAPPIYLKEVVMEGGTRGAAHWVALRVLCALA